MKLPLVYLLVTKFKNQLRSFFKSPVKLIYLAVILFLIGVNMFSGRKLETQPGRVVRDIGELTAIVTAFYSLMFVLLASKGFKTGASMFSMADVNLIFPAPFRQQSVLFYGLFQQLGTSLLLGLFLFFQYSWMHSLYDVTLPMLLVILLGYAFTVFFGQIAAMVLYTFTSADDKRRGLFKAIFYAVVIGFVLYAALSGLGDTSRFLARAVEAVNSAATWFFPVSGWTGHAVAGVFTGNMADLLLGVAICAAFLALIINLMTHTRQDYYEDVLKSSEIMQSAITARKEGRMAEAAPQNVKLGKTGIGRGAGADVIYYKHKLENRRARVFIMDTVRLIYAVIIIAMAFFMKKAGLPAGFITATIMQIFTVALGRFNKELTKPFIYLIPEPPLKKMLFALAESAPSSLTEAIIIFVPVAFILGLTPAVAVLCIVARLSFEMLFLAGNMAVERLWGGNSSKALVMFLYFFVMILMAAPGIVLAVVLTTLNAFANADAAVLISLTVVNVPISLLVFYLCRNMLQFAELNQT
jgi:hypothetical protein